MTSRLQPNPILTFTIPIYTVGTVGFLNWTLAVQHAPLTLVTYDLKVYQQIPDQAPCAKKVSMARASSQLSVGVNTNSSLVGPSGSGQAPWTYVIAVANCVPGGGIYVDYDFNLQTNGVWTLLCQ